MDIHVPPAKGWGETFSRNPYRRQNRMFQGLTCPTASTIQPLECNDPTRPGDQRNSRDGRTPCRFGRLERMTDWDQIIRRDGPAVWRTVSRLVGDRADAEECFQEAFVAALELARREPLTSPRALLLRM